MCGILTCSDKSVCLETFQEGFQTLFQRGPDEQTVLELEHGYLGFARLSIMGSQSGHQPFYVDHQYYVCNGEIYGFRKWKEKLDFYSFQTESDCEVLIPLFQKYGLDLFSNLDAEFACVFYQEKTDTWIAARDPIGIRPLFYGYTKNHRICFGSTLKSLQPFCQEIHPFPIGHYYDGEKFICYRDVTKAKPHHDSFETVLKNIHDRLIDGVVKRMDSDSKVGYLLSGGLDSSLVCSIAQRHQQTPIRTFAIGMDKDAIDLKYARQVAEYIGCDHTEVIINKKDVLQALNQVIYSLESWDITTIRASVGMYLLCQYIHEHTDIKVLFTGEISDELFGYKYTDFAPDAFSFQQESLKRVRELYMYDVLRADRCISDHCLESRVPFGDLAFVDYVLGIDPQMKMNTYGMGKYLLRKAFEQDDLLPKDILYRDKAAFSDAVGHSLVDILKAYAEKLYPEKIAYSTYAYCSPYTKESFLYRSIFSSYFEGYDDVIVGYWLPNQQWVGDQTNDPSARYLRNYGLSGI